MKVIGVMSGSSLDGIDVACCDFSKADGPLKFKLEGARTVAYDAGTRERLMRASTSTALELARLHHHIGLLIGEACALLLKEHPAELIASHGHTVFHQPGEGFTTQIGCGATIAARTGLPVVCDFRTKDVALGGQGAPLVPIGERDLFDGFDAYVNLGGIANISVHRDGRVTGTDVCFCNQPLNYLASLAGKEYDDDGALARGGRPDEGLDVSLMSMSCLASPPPFSLGREHFEMEMMPLLRQDRLSLPDLLATSVEHTARLLAEALKKHNVSRCLVTGGGAFNGFLMERLRARIKAQLVVPETRMVSFKEAIIFAYLGWLRWHERPNALASVTGASRDSVGGALYLPN